MNQPLIFGLLFSLAANAAHAGLYSIEVLPNHPTDQFTVMSSINDHGQVIGESYSGVFISGPKRIVSYRRGEGLQVIIDNLSQNGLQYLPVVNNSGQIAYSHNLRPGVFNDLTRTYRYTPGQGSEELASPNPNLSYLPVNINNRGDVVGESLNSAGYFQRSVLWRTGQGAEVLSGGYEIVSITDDRTLVGTTPIGGFVRREGQNPVLLTYPNDSGWALQMNSQGQVLGGYVASSTSFPTWLWAPNLIDHVEIPISGGLLRNDGGITGGVNPLAGRFQSLGNWSPDRGFEEITQMLDSDALSHGFDRWSVADINHRGEILASAWTHDPNNQFYEPRFNIILRPHPVPEPGTMIALGAGLAALLRRRRTS